MSTRTQTVRGPLRFPAPARRLLVGCLFLLLFPACCRQQPRVRVVIRQSAPLLDIAAREMAARLEQTGYKVEIATGPGANAGQVNAIIFTVDASTPALQPEGFQIIPLRASGFFLFRVIGNDPRGVLWGSQELAEQIASSGRLETVEEQTANPLFPLRAIGLPLPLPENAVSPQAKTETRDRWRERLDLLSRSRFNSIFFETTDPLGHFVNFPDGPDGPAFSAQAVKPNVDWLRDLFKMAQERGLDAYLRLTKASLEELLAQDGPPPGAAGNAPAQPPDQSNPLAEALPALLRTYPELAGVALDRDVLTLSGTPERGRWMAENFLATLAEIQERRPIFLSVDRDWWPSKEEWGPMALSSTIHFLAPLSMLGEAQREPGYPVLWRLDAPLPPLRPWEDPAAVRETLQRMGEKNSLGFLDESWKSPPAHSQEVGTEARYGPPPVEEDWFRLLLWGRMGYSTNVSDKYGEQQFAARFGNLAGPAVYAAAAHSSKALSLLPGSAEDSRPLPETGVRPENISAAAQEFLFVKFYLLQPASVRSSPNFITELLSEKKLLLPSEEKQRAGFLLPETLEQEAQQALSEAAKAARYGAWKGAANENFYRRIQSVASTGFALAENFRAAQALARFLLDGEESNRRQALQHWQQAQEALAAGSAQNLPGDFSALSSLPLQLSQAIEMSPRLQPWRWEKANWEVGTVEGWQPTVPTDVPVPQKWLPARTSWLSEFGPYGRQPWMSAINQQLRSAFLPAPGELSLTPASLLVGRTRFPVRETGRLVLRLVSDQPGTVWVNRRQATGLPPQQFPWVAASPPAPPLRAQLFSQEVQPGNAEVIVAIAVKKDSPLISLSYLFVPDTRSVVSLAVRQTAQLEGGVEFVPGTEASPQPHLTITDQLPIGSPEAARTGTASQALFRFSVREPGFYRFRLWCYWPTFQSSGLDLVLDGSVLRRAVGRNDPLSQQWHWIAVGAAADLGAGEHTLAIIGWKPGARLGSIEVFPAGGTQTAVLPGSS